ncbi:PHP domain-containing protein [Candidatus Bathyarchaeota archaeon]|nr:PHP domain-containing protein [Candidatus Bathyarchaeota archaeon]
MILKIDIHIHTTASPDGSIPPQEIPRILKLKQLDGVAVTDHDRFFDKEVRGGIVVPGIEVSTREGHLLGLGDVEEITPGLSVDETIRIIHERGGVAILAHPYDLIRGGIRPAHVTEPLDGIETINSRAHPFRLSKYLAERTARRLGIPTLGGSDSHTPETVGDAYTLVDARSTSLKDILDAIRDGDVKAQGGPSGSMNDLRQVRRRIGRSP